MKWLSRLVVASALVAVGASGCSEVEAPPAFASAASDPAPPSPPSSGGGCDATSVAGGSGSVDQIATELALAQHGFVEALEANDAVDRRLERHLSRVGLALNESRLRAFAAQYETREDVRKARKEYADKTVQLAAKLDEIDGSDSLAHAMSNVGTAGGLIAAYDLLSRSPCPARAVRFAATVLSLSEGAPSRYALLLESSNAKLYAYKFLHAGVSGALVERAIQTESNPEAVLGEIHGWLSRTNGQLSTLLAVIKSKEDVLAASRLGKPVVAFEQDALPIVRGIGSVLSIWSAAEDVAAGDIEGLLKGSGPGGIQAVLEGTNTIRRALDLEEYLWASKGAAVAGKLASGIGIVIQVIETVEGVRTMKDADDVIRTLGNALILSGSIIALTGGSGAIFIAVGTAAKILADILATPPEDECRAILLALAATDTALAESVEPLARARNGGLRNLAGDLQLPADDVLWIVTRSPYAAANGDGFHGLVQLGASFGLKGATMTAFLRAIVDPADLVWQRWEMFVFNGYINLSHSFRRDDPAAMRANLDAWAKDFDASGSTAEEWGRSEAELTAHGRAVFARSLSNLPAR